MIGFALPGLTELIVLFAIGLPTLVVLIVVPIVLLVKGGKVGRAIVGGLVVLLLLSFFVIFSFRPVAYEAASSRSTSGVPVLQERVYPSNTLPAIWSEGLDNRFTADIYPSKKSAARALGQQLSEFFPSVLPEISKNAQPESSPDTPAKSASEEPARPTVIQIYSLTDDELLPTDALHAAADGIRQTNENLKVLVETAPPAKLIEKTDSSAITIKVSCSIQEKQAAAKKQLHQSDYPQLAPFVDQHSGTIVMEISGRDGQISRSVDFAGKPWFENYADFVNQHPRRNWAMVRSQDACTTSSQATQQADKAIQHYITQRLRDQGMLNQNEPLTISLDDFVQDRFVQSLDGSAGRIWREAVLLEISGEKVKKLIQTVYQNHTIQYSHIARKLFSAVGLLVLICLVYLFLNAATKGYYVWSLRIAALIIGIAFIILLSKFS